MTSSEYPPLPRSEAREEARSRASGNLPFRDITTSPFLSGPERTLSEVGSGRRREYHQASGSSTSSTRVISSHGDVLVEYTNPGSNSLSSYPVSCRWRVASSDLVRNSPYFRALLDPNKFAEGQQFMKQKATFNRISARGNMSSGEGLGRNDVNDKGQRKEEGEEDEEEEEGISQNFLPTVALPVDSFKRKIGIDVVELFLKILSLDSFDEEAKQRFYGELRSHPPFVVARLIELSDIFNSPGPLKNTLQKSGYSFGKGKISLTRFSSSLLKISEDRIRQTIFIAMFLKEQAIFQVFTHTLIVLGSKFWVNGVGITDPESPRWRHFGNGLEGKNHL